MEGRQEVEQSNTKRSIAMIETSMGTMKIELWNDLTPTTVDSFIGLAAGTREWVDPRSGSKVKRPFYNGLIFHRVIPDFMIQGGCPRGEGTGGPGYSFEDECYDSSSAKALSGKIQNEEDAIAVLQGIVMPYLQNTPNPDSSILRIFQECRASQNVKPIMSETVEFYQGKTGIDTPLRSKGKLKASVEYGTICMANSGPNTNGSQFFIVTKKDGCEWLNGKHTVFGKVMEGMDIAEKIQEVPRGANDKPVKPVTIIKVTIN
jgi:peptidyl-prolyl cis-trans isomerase A (cyclophilin A)